MPQILFAALLVMLTVTPAHPQETSKTVFISADMEGISGVVGPEQLAAGGAEYDRSRRLMADDVNAAVRGARAGGARRIVVNDSHGSMQNLRIEDLEGGVQLISHSFKRYGMMEGLDDSFDAAIFIGYHTKGGSPAGIFAHTGSGIVRDVRVNGQSLGEGGLNTLVAAWYGVPVVLVTGDDAAVEEVGRVATGARKVTVKRAINPRAAELRPLADVHNEILRAAREAVAAAARREPRREKTYTVEVQFNDLLIPQIAEILPEMERPAPDTIRFTVTEMPRAYALIRLLYRYIDPD
jgi:D-amino peptidase